MKLRNLIIVLGAASLLSCNSNMAYGNIDPQASELIVSKTPPAVASDSMTYTRDTTCIPCDTINDNPVLYDGGVYHGDEVPDYPKEKKWTGLFKSRKGYYLDETTITITPAYDGIVDEDTTARSGKMIKTNHKDTLVLLISGLGLSDRKKTENLIRPSNFVHPEDDTIKFSFKDAQYSLYASGIKRSVEGMEDLSDYLNYKLYLRGSKNGTEITQILFATELMTYQSMLFIGDIDGDDTPDMIFDFSGFNSSAPTLHLSGKAPAYKLLKKVGQWITTGC